MSSLVKLLILFGFDLFVSNYSRRKNINLISEDFKALRREIFDLVNSSNILNFDDLCNHIQLLSISYDMNIYFIIRKYIRYIRKIYLHIS